MLLFTLVFADLPWEHTNYNDFRNGPFRRFSRNQELLFQNEPKIKGAYLRNEIDKNLKSLLFTMLKVDPLERASSIEQVLAHDFFRAAREKEE